MGRSVSLELELLWTPWLVAGSLAARCCRSSAELSREPQGPCVSVGTLPTRVLPGFCPALGGGK